MSTAEPVVVYTTEPDCYISATKPTSSTKTTHDIVATKNDVTGPLWIACKDSLRVHYGYSARTFAGQKKASETFSFYVSKDLEQKIKNVDEQVKKWMLKEYSGIPFCNMMLTNKNIDKLFKESEFDGVLKVKTLEQETHFFNENKEYIDYKTGVQRLKSDTYISVVVCPIFFWLMDTVFAVLEKRDIGITWVAKQILFKAAPEQTDSIWSLSAPEEFVVNSTKSTKNTKTASWSLSAPQTNISVQKQAEWSLCAPEKFTENQKGASWSLETLLKEPAWSISDLLSQTVLSEEFETAPALKKKYRKQLPPKKPIISPTESIIPTEWSLTAPNI